MGVPKGSGGLLERPGKTCYWVASRVIFDNRRRVIFENVRRVIFDNGRRVIFDNVRRASDRPGSTRLGSVWLRLVSAGVVGVVGPDFCSPRTAPTKFAKSCKTLGFW